MWGCKTLALWTVLCCGSLPGVAESFMTRPAAAVDRDPDNDGALPVTLSGREWPPLPDTAALDAEDTQQSASPNPSGTANQSTTTPNTNAGNQKPLAVNPVTGLSSVSARNYRPLTGKERWKLYWKQNYWSIGAYFGPFFTALVLDQTTNTPSEWGGGVPGFARRLGSRTLTGILQGTFQAAMAAPLHEDVRYISSGQVGFKRRVLHAIAFSFVTYNSQGHTTLNISNLTGYYAATAVSTFWVPIRGSVAEYTLTNGTEQIGLSVPVNILQEFWPEIRRKIRRRP